MFDTLTHLSSASSAHPSPPQRSPCASPSSSPTRFSVNKFVQKWTASGLSSSLLDLLTQALSSSRVGDQPSTSPEASARFPRPTISPTVTPVSGLCLLAVRLFTALVRFPRHVNLLSLISPPPDDDDAFPSLIQVTSKLTVTLGGLILRRARREPSAPSTSTASTSSAKIRGTLPVLRVSSSTPGMSQLLATLELVNAQLNFIADVVRYALTCRQQKAVDGCTASQEPPNTARSHCNQPTAEELATVIECLPSDLDSICIVAEQLLVAARPPPHLPGILASFLEASTETVGISNGSEAMGSDSDQRPSEDEWSEERDETIAMRLVEASTTALASLASLYGGEYCRTALSAAGLRGFAVALIHLSSERKQPSATQPLSANGRPKSDNRGHQVSVVGASRRRRARLLLRILRRLADSDEWCARRLTSLAAKHLQVAISHLRIDAQVLEDSATVRLAGVILEKLQRPPIAT
ncbi:hypothetical protein AAHC03_0817 [Spirometra sp. Aus1]